MVHVKIIVNNTSAETQQFMIFNDKPAFSEAVGVEWTNVWGHSPGVGAEHGSTKFKITERYYTVCGMDT